MSHIISFKPRPFAKQLSGHFPFAQHLEVFKTSGVPEPTIPLIWGFIPEFLLEQTESFIPQINKNYAHGGGWSPLKGAKPAPHFGYQYPGDPEQSMISALFNPTIGQLLVMHDYCFCSIWIWEGSEEPSLMRESIVAGDTTNWKFGSVARMD